MKQRSLGPDLKVAAIGLGCMGMSHAYGGQDEAASIRTLHRAVELGVTLFDTAEVYGPYENEILLGKAMKGLRHKIILATKFGFEIAPASASGLDRMVGLNGRPDNARRVAEESLKRLGTDVIDLYYIHRFDLTVPVEDSIGAMADLVRAGKVRHLGISEATPEQIRRAHAVHPIAALQSEYSLWERGIEPEILPVIRELNIGLVPFSPLGRGFLAGSVKTTEDLSADDFRKRLPRFQAEALAANARFLETVERIAAEHRATKAQIALAWVLAMGEDIVPIPGTRRVDRLEENLGALELTLTPSDLAALDEAMPAQEIMGARYNTGAAWVPKTEK